MQSLLILGRQPAFGLAELESLYGADSIRRVGNYAALLDIDPTEVRFGRLGGSIKLAKVLASLDSTDWQKLIDYIAREIPKHLDRLPEGKIKLGLSAYGLSINAAKVNASALTVKKTIKSSGRSVRVIPNNEPALNSAQVLNNKLVGELGMELLLVKNGNSTILAQTVAEQDIDAYAARDHGRPKRDSKVGMLPPKLAQVIINLAKPGDNSAVLDPFCGTGVVLQEAQLMGYEAYGTDLEPRMIEYSKDNISWLQQTFRPTGQISCIEQADATSTKWSRPFSAIACETYLGRPFSALPKPDVLQEVMQDVSYIHKKFLQNVALQTQPGFRMCIAVPAWKTPHGFKHLKMLDSLEEIGYTRLKFVHAAGEDLIYHRPGQVVARELVVLQRK